MIDPIIFEFDIFGVHLALHWYGLIVGIGVMLGAWITTKEIDRRGGDADAVWDMLPYLVIGGILGARLYYVLNDILGGGTYFTTNPGKILAITEGGIHIYGGIIGGLLGGYLYSRKRSVNWWLLLDTAGPALLIGQGVGRLANYINQELYGPPTDKSWGIPIEQSNRIGEWRDMTLYPETVRFHPTFAYEMIWNFSTAAILIWLSRKFPKKMKPGTALYLWLIVAGAGRYIIEFWRPDQPRVGNTDISVTRVVNVIMMLVGLLLLLNRMEVIKLPGIKPGPEEYSFPKKKKYEKQEKQKKQKKDKK